MRNSLVTKRQSIIRKRTDSRFTITPNEIAQSKNLTHGAKGLLLQMLSYPNDWAFNLRHLASQSASGLHATRTAFEELQTAGYVSRTLQRDDRGHLLGYEYTVTDTPTVVRFPDDGLSDNGEPHATNTECTKTNPTKTKSKTTTLVQNAENDTTVLTLSATPTRVSNKQLLDIWNQHCGVLPRVTRLNDKRNDGLDYIRREFGDDTEECFTNAVKQVASDDHWIAKPYGLDNLLVRGRVLEKHEKYLANGTMSKGDRAMANTAMRIMHAIGGFDAN
jgi:hypothetical protein